MIELKRAGYTKLGFSKAGFGCCGHHSICNMGRQKCYYDEIDPEVKDYCAAYVRYHKRKTNLEPSFFIVKNEERSDDITVTEEDDGQLALF